MKVVYDDSDGFAKSPHDVTAVKDAIYTKFNVRVAVRVAARRSACCARSWLVSNSNSLLGCRVLLQGTSVCTWGQHVISLIRMCLILGKGLWFVLT